MQPIRRLVRLAGALLGFALYVWFAAVRRAPAVKRRKAVRRARRLGAGASVSRSGRLSR